MPYLILIGPLCIALINLMQNTGKHENLPRGRGPRHTRIRAESEQSLEILDAWTWIPWKEAPYLSLDLPKEGLDPQTTYVTIAVPTFSLVAPLLPASSRWINLATFGPEDEKKSALYSPISENCSARVDR
jgi:hypothetical protein